MTSVTSSLLFLLAESADYLEAVRAGDLKLAQSLVNQAAAAAGYSHGPVHHASTYGTWTAFDLDRSVFGKAGYGAYFSDQDGANLFKEYGEKFQMPRNWQGVAKNPRVLSCFLSIHKPFKADHVDDLAPHLDRGQSFGVGREYQKVKPPNKTRLESQGYDAIITTETTAQKVHKTQGLKILHRDDPKAKAFPVVVVFTAEQIKLADPVTYDDQGEVIPLEQRFDRTNPDIRY